MKKIYFTGGIGIVNNPIYGVLRHLQDKLNETIDQINNIDKQLIELKEVKYNDKKGNIKSKAERSNQET